MRIILFLAALKTVKQRISFTTTEIASSGVASRLTCESKDFLSFEFYFYDILKRFKGVESL